MVGTCFAYLPDFQSILKNNAWKTNDQICSSHDACHKNMANMGWGFFSCMSIWKTFKFFFL